MDWHSLCSGYFLSEFRTMAFSLQSNWRIIAFHRITELQMMDDLWVNVKAVGFKAESISDYAPNEEFKFAWGKYKAIGKLRTDGWAENQEKLIDWLFGIIPICHFYNILESSNLLQHGCYNTPTLNHHANGDMSMVAASPVVTVPTLMHGHNPPSPMMSPSPLISNPHQPSELPNAERHFSR